jgi:aspartyl-tRNA(Asn)/glutamyl-tRNA(Gln) amidotransferase subunit A
VVGLKPTYGRVSRYGLIALASSFDSIGPVTRTVEDAGLVLRTIAGLDPQDSTSRAESVPVYADNYTHDLAGVRLGIPEEYFGDGIESGVLRAIQTAIETLKDLGAEVQPISLPHTRYAIPVYYLVMFAEASSNLARFDSVRFGLSVSGNANDYLERYLHTRQQGFGDEVKRRIMLGTYALSAGYYDAYYLRAQRVRSLIRQDFEQAFEKVDALVTPVCPTTAFKIGEKVDDPLKMYLSDIHVVAANPAGIPGLSIPCGFSSGMPVGLQLLGLHLNEGMLFKIGHAYQQVTDWHKQKPMFSQVSDG